MKPPRAKLPLSVVAVIVCAFAFAGVLYTEDVGLLRRTTIFTLGGPCTNQVGLSGNSSLFLSIISVVLLVLYIVCCHVNVN